MMNDEEVAEYHKTLEKLKHDANVSRDKVKKPDSVCFLTRFYNFFKNIILGRD
jgi:hypothetical protein